MRHAKRRTRANAFARAAELSLLAPQIIALRSLRTHDAVEMQRMGTEKILAFWECATAMSLEMAKCSIWMSPWQAAAAGSKVLEEGLRPLHRRAAANARRLKRRR